MAKQEKILWGFFAGILVFLYLLSSTDLIIKEKKTEIYPVSIVIGDTTDDYYVNFRKGVEQAADDYNVDISFITLFEKEDADSQMELVKRESEDGALAVILEPGDPVECMSHMDTAALGSPVIVAGELLPVDSVKAAVSIDHYEAGKKMGEAIAAEHEPELPVYIFTDNQGHSYNGEVFEGLKSVLEENGFAMAVYERKSPDTFRKVIEETVYPGSGTAVVACLDASSTSEAADIIGGSPVYGRYIAGLYGTGTTPSLLGQMDKGVIRGMIVSNEFDEGYLCVEKAVEAIRRGSAREQITLETYYIEKTDLRENKFEKILYPID